MNMENNFHTLPSRACSHPPPSSTTSPLLVSPFNDELIGSRSTSLPHDLKANRDETRRISLGFGFLSKENKIEENSILIELLFQEEKKLSALKVRPGVERHGRGESFWYSKSQIEELFMLIWQFLFKFFCLHCTKFSLRAEHLKAILIAFEKCRWGGKRFSN